MDRVLGRCTPFTGTLTHDNDGVYNLGGVDWSSNNMNAIYIFAYDGILSEMAIAVGDSGFTPGTGYVTSTAPGTNILGNIAIVDSSGTTTQEIFNSNLSTRLMFNASQQRAIEYHSPSGVTTNNEFIASYSINFRELFGGNLFVKAGDRVRLFCNSSLTNQTLAGVIISGYYFT